MKQDKKTPVREFLTVFFRRRSIIALCCGCLTLALAFYGIIAGVIRTVELLGVNGFESFIYFTMLANVLAALSVAFVIPYAVDGIRKRRFTLPKWVAVFHYVATIGIAIVMVFVLAVISWASPGDAFGGSNIVTHLLCPLLILVCFFQMENGHLLTVKDRLLGIVPFCVYLAVYFVEVVAIGEENGGWPDIYKVTEHLPGAIAIPLAALIAFGVSTAVALVSNVLTKKRTKKMYSFWLEDMDPVEVRVEAFSIGRMAAQSGEPNDLHVPYDILEHLSQRYGMTTGELIKPFVKGMLTELEDRKQNAPSPPRK